MKKGRFNIAE